MIKYVRCDVRPSVVPTPIYPRVSLEAVTNGTLLMASPVGGLRDLFKEGDRVLVQSNDPKCCAEEIAALCKDCKQQRELTAMGERRIVADYSWHSVSVRLNAELLA